MDTRDFRPGLSETEMVKPTRLLSCSLLFLPLFLSPSPCCSVSLIISLSLSYYFFLRFSLLLALSSCSIPLLCYLNLSFPPRAIVYSVLVVIPDILNANPCLYICCVYRVIRCSENPCFKERGRATESRV